MKYLNDNLKPELKVVNVEIEEFDDWELLRKDLNEFMGELGDQGEFFDRQEFALNFESLYTRIDFPIRISLIIGCKSYEQRELVIQAYKQDFIPFIWMRSLECFKLIDKEEYYI